MEQLTANVLAHPVPNASKSRALAITAGAARVMLGVIFLVFGLNGFLHFIPVPPPTGTAGEFLFGLVKAGYLLPLVSAVQVISGFLLLAGFAVPFALLLLFPITLNIFLFHVALAPAGLGMAVFNLAAHLLLAAYYWPVYKPLFTVPNAWKGKTA